MKPKKAIKRKIEWGRQGHPNKQTETNRQTEAKTDYTKLKKARERGSGGRQRQTNRQTETDRQTIRNKD